MRNKLRLLGNSKRYNFIGEIIKLGCKKGYKGVPLPTLLMKNIKLAGTKQILTDHLWLNYTKGFLKLGELYEGDLISFDARVSDYYKGYIVADKHDCGLAYPTKVKFVNPQPKRQLMPLSNDEIVGYIMKKNKAFYLKNNRPYNDWYVKCYEEWLKNQR